ncbi:ankyrin repeat and MYND domain-containing protein 1-like isoform X2 [Anneissia japonica]|uniref:ankyrin repeat and MYND domain-containing protein 1-like isoform X2 n=1 Tax=Anneissia japonica TaxID=1529436 RepID=UPI0014258188|nr:ankyrin repeat and MYND domain-containing protein 1-like isoform X2 [Anneissia japonica]
MPSTLEFYTFARLKSAKQETRSDHCNYKSGASFSGRLKDNKRTGVGIFLWPSGDKYEGEYLDNERHGKGKQGWSDGSFYEGDFVMDTRHGEGYHKWANGESYEGSYFKDHRHGNGTYTWPGDLKFEGKFYMDKKEGYGIFTFPNGSVFKGLYKEDEREGPGIMTYTDKTEEIGLWQKERLIKLTSQIEGAFSMKDHPEFDYIPDENMVTVTQADENPQKNHHFNSGVDLNAVMAQFSDTSLMANLEDDILITQPESVDMRTLQYDKEEYDVAFFGESQTDDDRKSFIAVNNTPSLINMLKHVQKHKRQELFSVQEIMQGKRENSSCKGPIEIASKTLILSAASGDYAKVNALLQSNEANVNVADKNGHHGLIAAAVNMHCDIINCLLDNGADVNKLNDEGVSALAACHVFFYPSESFQYNIAERYLPKPEDVVEHERMIMDLTNSSATPGNLTRSEFTNQTPGPAEDDFGEAEIVQPVEDDDGDDFLEEELPEELMDPSGSVGSRTPDDLETIAHPNKIRGTELNEFSSNKSLVNYSIEVKDDFVERSATVMSGNPKIVAGRTSKCAAKEPDMDPARLLAISKAEHSVMESTIRLLLKRGADPNASRVPMAVLFFAIKAADVGAVKILLEKGASTETRLSAKKEGLSPLHISSAIRGKAGVDITRLLLEAGAEPNVRAYDHDLEDEDGEFNPVSPTKLKPGLDSSVLALSMELQALGEEKGGRTPLHIACQRDDDNKLAQQVVNLLLLHGANPNVLCRGQSPLSLAIAYGNDLAIDELLAFSANPSLPLGQSIGSALCVSSNTVFEFRRSPQDRINLISKLVKAGANILAPVAVGAKKLMGTAVDYAYWAFNQDRRIAHMPYHALTHTERDTYNARRRLLAYLGDILREASVRKEKERLVLNERDGLRSVSPSHGFLYTGAGAQPTGDRRPSGKYTSNRISPVKGYEGEPGRQVAFRTMTKDNVGCEQPLVDRDEEVIIRKPLFKYCYECGRSLGVRLSACTRCKEVYYCSKACKIKAWNARHKEECIRVGGRSRSPSPTSKAARRSMANSSDSLATGGGDSGAGSSKHPGGGRGGGGGGSRGKTTKGQMINHRGQGDSVKGKSGINGLVKNNRLVGKKGGYGLRGMTSDTDSPANSDITENYSFN